MPVCLGSLWGFFKCSANAQPCTEQQKFYVWSCVQSCASHLTLTFLHSLLDQRNEAYMHEQCREFLRQAAGAAKRFHHGAMAALLTAPLVSLHAGSDVVPNSILPGCFREQEPAGTTVGLMLTELLRVRVPFALLNLAPAEAWGGSEIFLLTCKGRIRSMAYVLENLSARSWILYRGPYNTYIAIVSYYYCMSFCYLLSKTLLLLLMTLIICSRQLWP